MDHKALSARLSALLVKKTKAERMPERARKQLAAQYDALLAEIAEVERQLASAPAVTVQTPAAHGADGFRELPRGVWPPENDRVGCGRVDPLGMREDSWLWEIAFERAKASRKLTDALVALRKGGAKLLEAMDGRVAMYGNDALQRRFYEPNREAFRGGGYAWQGLFVEDKAGEEVYQSIFGR